jgi:hypothetical protein
MPHALSSHNKLMGQQKLSQPLSTVSPKLLQQ